MEEEMKEALKKFGGAQSQLKKTGTLNKKDVSDVVEALAAEHGEVFKKAGFDIVRKDKSKNNKQGSNPIDKNTGETMKCHSCSSTNHLSFNCYVKNKRL